MRRARRLRGFQLLSMALAMSVASQALAGPALASNWQQDAAAFVPKGYVAGAYRFDEASMTGTVAAFPAGPMIPPIQAAPSIPVLR